MEIRTGNSAHDSAATAWVVDLAKRCGFDLCGVVRAEKFPELSQNEEWLARGYAGEMKYLSDPRRSDPQAVLAGVRSLIVCALNYNSAAPRSTEAGRTDETEPRGWISRYAWGDDYHEVLAQKLRRLADGLSERFAEPFEARAYVDTGPLHERVLAKHAGLGWLGKNTLLLNSKLGSWFFLGVILTTLDLPPTLGPSDAPPPDLCGSCRKCIDACPTDALVEPYVLDARLCISYLTIELRGAIPENLREPMGRHVFGCDICQDVCPWNRRAPVTDAPEFQPRMFPAVISTEADNGGAFETDTAAEERGAPQADSGGAPRTDSEHSGAFPTGAEASENESLLLPRLEWIASLTAEEFRDVFRGSAIKRTKWRGLMRNACIALGNSAAAKGTEEDGRIAALLTRLADSAEPVIAESARWALSRIQQ